MQSRLPRRVRPHAARGPERARTLRSRAPLRPAHAPRPAAPAEPGNGLLLRFTRHGIPALIVLAGVVAMCIGSETSLIGGAGLIGAGLSSWLVGWFYRLGVSSDDEREREERARASFERTGRWPEA